MTTKRIKHLVELVNSRLQPVMEFDRFYAALYDPIRSLIEFPWGEQDGKSIEWATRPYQATSWLLDSIIHTKASRLVEQDLEQVLAKDSLKYWPEGELPQSWLAAPMMIGDRVIGVLVAENRRKSKVFGENDLRVLSSAARQTAQSIENARLVDQREHKIASLSALHEMGQQLNSGIRLDEPKIMQLIYEQATPLMDTSNLYIALYDETTDIVSFPLMYEDGQPVQLPSRREGTGPTESIIRSQKSILIETRTESEAWYKEPGREEYIGEAFASWVGVPMIAGDKVLGVIATYHKTQDYVYTKDDQEILSLMANQAAVAIENARLYSNLEEMVQERTKQLQKRNEQLTALQEIGVKITSQLELKEVLGSIAEHANTIMSADFSTIFPYDSIQNKFDAGVRKGESEVEPFTPSSTGYSARLADSREAIFAETAESSGAKPTFIENKKVQSFAGIPLTVKGQTVGILYINYFERHSFSKEEQDVIELLANQAAVAIENARLYSSLEEMVQERTRQLQEKVKELDREKRDLRSRLINAEGLLITSRFAAGYVHRVNNLIGTIPIRVGQIEEKLADMPDILEKLKPYLKGIAEDAKRVGPITKELSELTHQESQPELVDVVEALDRMARRVRIEAPAEIRLEENYSSDERLYVRAVAWELSDAFWNVLKNGADAMPKGGALSLAVTKIIGNAGQALAEIQIHNSGPKIPQDSLDRIFEPFHSTKGGTGYGLWRSRHVFQEEIGGSISINNDNNEQPDGVTVTIRLPLATKEN